MYYLLIIILFQIVALTIVRGNIPIDQALINTARILKMVDRLEV